jgi:hypothetical protein
MPIKTVTADLPWKFDSQHGCHSVPNYIAFTVETRYAKTVIRTAIKQFPFLIPEIIQNYRKSRQDRRRIPTAKPLRWKHGTIASLNDAKSTKVEIPRSLR